ncbi:MAG: hypothetical protein JWL84_5957 [Rhodospirillales bacterium]|nr:hypothetical protein [Rhodospirillales bacterium]
MFRIERSKQCVMSTDGGSKPTVRAINLRRVKGSLRARAFSFSRWIVPAVVLPRLLAELWRARKDIASAEILVVYEGGGFGHHICGPDALRRLYPHRSVLILLGAFPGEENWRVPLIWREPRVRFLPFAVAMPETWQQRAIRVPVRLQMGFCKALARALAFRFPRKKVIASSFEVFDEVWLEAERSDLVIATIRTGEIVEWMAPYYRLMRFRPAPPIRLPDTERAVMARHLAESARSLDRPPSGLCCLYLRAKGAEVEVVTSSRSGSALMEYVPAIHRLVAAGYRCLLIGDRILTNDVAAIFGGWLVDAAALRVDPGLFSLYAATEADIFIGEAGGGSLPPGVNGIPALTVNHFPYYVTRLHATVFPKFCYDSAGRMIPPEIMFGEYSHLHAIPGGTVRSNTAEELEIAVSEFIRLQRRGVPEGVVVEDIVGTPNSLWYADADSRLSPAWLELARQRQASYSAIVQ